MNETLLMEMLNKSAGTQALTSTNYIFYAVISLVSGLMIWIIIFSPRIFSFISLFSSTKPFIRKWEKMSGRKVIILSHKGAGLFGSMITMEDVIKIEKIIRKHKDRGIDLMVNTFGGDLLASLRLAMLVKRGDIRVIVPKYAWSGGSLVALASPQLLMNSTATLSPVDPQLGSLLKFYSSKYWMEIIKKKGNKSDDNSIAMARMSKEILSEMRKYLRDILKGKKIDEKKFNDMFLYGKRTHSDQFTPDVLKDIGIKTKSINSEIPDMIIESLKIDGVIA